MTVTIDEKELARVAKQRRFDARTLEIAHRLIIGKEPPLLLAAEYGVIHQRIYAIRPDGLAALRRYLDRFWGDVLVAYQEALENEPVARD